MKICLIAPTFLPARRANTVQVMKMAQALTALGNQVLVTVPGEHKTGPAPTWSELSHHYGLQQQFEVEWLPARGWLRRYDYGFRAVRYARRHGADLIYTRLPQSAALAGLLGIPTIYEVHDFPTGRGAKMLFRLFLRGSGARRLVVITRALRDDLIRWINTLPVAPFTIVAPDGVDLARYADTPSPAEARRALSLPERFTVGYTGHLYPGRGAGLILSLAARLPEMTFLLVGGDPEDVAKARAEAEKAGLSNVILSGFVANAELPRYQAACDILLMPYQQRVAASSGGDIARYLSPLKLFEYMVSGRPIISSDLSVLEEVLNRENALLLPPSDIDAWAAAIQELSMDAPRREALARQAKVDIQGYSWKARAGKVLAGL